MGRLGCVQAHHPSVSTQGRKGQPPRSLSNSISMDTPQQPGLLVTFTLPGKRVNQPRNKLAFGSQKADPPGCIWVSRSSGYSPGLTPGSPFKAPEPGLLEADRGQPVAGVLGEPWPSQVRAAACSSLCLHCTWPTPLLSQPALPWPPQKPHPSPAWILGLVPAVALPLWPRHRDKDIPSITFQTPENQGSSAVVARTWPLGVGGWTARAGLLRAPSFLPSLPLLCKQGTSSVPLPVGGSQHPQPWPHQPAAYAGAGAGEGWPGPSTPSLLPASSPCRLPHVGSHPLPGSSGVETLASFARLDTAAQGQPPTEYRPRLGPPESGALKSHLLRGGFCPRLPHSGQPW